MDEQREPVAQLPVRPDPVDEQAEILALVAPLRRFALSRLHDVHDADDVVQETLTRVLAARGRLEEGTLTGYAFTVARNLVAAHYREAELHRRHAPRLVEPGEPERPEHVVLAAEDRRALGAALGELPEEQRDQLVEHVVHDVPVTDLGEGPGAVAAQLARTRARLRLDYVLALRGVTLPTARCRPVLLAVSAGDRRRQAALRAVEHLAVCRTCAELSEPLLRRRRALAGVVPWIPLGAWHGRIVRWVRGHPAQTAASAGVTAAVVAVLAVIASGAPAAPPSPSTPPSPVVSPTASARAAAPSPLTGPAGPVLPVAARLADLAGRTVRAHGVRVLAVPADEGFWVGEGPGRRVWVQLRSNGESRVTMRPGQRLTFTGRVVRDDADFVRRAGVTDAEGAGELARQGAHVEVDPDDLVVPTEPVPS
ncbi:MAG TPA: sigma-70 family RNA polymerase sigma factor [Kineosporiaceae bacterium]|nr:sigma-70 family RNA polymerase sigma factor [Kineosporiaceae bacterium]